MDTVTELGKKAKAAATVLGLANTGQKNRALEAIALALESNAAKILEANAEDLDKAAENGVPEAMRDRLMLNRERIGDIAQAVREVARLGDPVGRIIGGHTAPNGMTITKQTVPLGVVAMIYESRPNVTVDGAVLCLKSGNACILRGGKEAIHSNLALAAIMRGAIEKEGLPPDCIQLIEDTSRESASALMKLDDYVNLLFPRGGKGLIRSVLENSTVPVIETGAGNCHIYVDNEADLTMAVNILHNAKTSRPSVCNAVETLLVHEEIAADFLPAAALALAPSNVELRCCPRSLRILSDSGISAVPAHDSDWDEEYDDLILAVKTVSGIDEAIAHIGRYSTKNSEAIVTSNLEKAERFCAGVDSAAVYVNVSTRFTDGGEFGLGAEIGISTQKLHARGPMGLEHLTSYKYLVRGNGQVR
ncbi:MAG: glutamate-5-semialdehyde dehydrogenase [Oscillospiraceae bacterium]|nr:glutamate-5-semialdehyde dehydrogenase [Oscillospiraceae bacterium]